MNLKHPYEKHLAEKLVQLPPPGDPDQNWQQMKTLLDKNMPRGGGKGPGGSYRWWIAGTVVVAVVAGTWFGGKQLLTKEQRNEAVAGTIKTVNNKTAPSVAYTDKNSSQQPVPPSGKENENAQAGRKRDPRGAAYASVNEPQSANTPESVNGNRPAANNNAVTAGKAERGRNITNKSPDAGSLASSDNNVVPANRTNTNNKTNANRNKIYSSRTNNTNRNNGNNTRNRNSRNNNIDNAGNNVRSNHEDAVVRNHASNGVTKPANANTKGNKERANKPNKNHRASDIINENNEDIDHRYTYTPKISLPSQPSNGSGLKESPVTIIVNYTGASVIAPSGVIQREFTYYTQNDLFPNAVQRNKHAARKSSRSSDEEEDKTFAFGLSLPLAFPLGDQEALGYNSRGGVNTISDYIPSPHFQYHFNNKTYVQAGLQFSSPQFIRPILLYEREWRPQPNVMQYNSIYARKLYYFNLPVSVYHSPLRNFYIGAGLQFSSMMSGVAQFQQIKRFNPIVGPAQEYITNYYGKFKNDSLSNRFNSNEVRLLLEVNYYWNRFTVGLMYNQAFNNYVSFQVNPGTPYIFDKNKSLQFYLRYNIWEDRKRNKLSKNQSVLTFK